MIEIKGDLFAASHKIIGHGVNLEGVMGAGVAKLIKEKYPEAYSDYRDAIKENDLTPGGVQVSATFGDKLIVHMGTQEFAGAEASLPLIIQSAMVTLYTALELGEDVVAIPRLGCGIGGLLWDDKYVGVKQTLLVVEEIFNSIYGEDSYTEFAVYSL